MMLRHGNIKATIWQNVSEKGPFYSETLSGGLKDQAGAWHNGNPLSLNDLEALMNVGREAKEWMTAHTPKPTPGEAMAACDDVALTSPQGWPSFAIIITDSSWMT